MGQLIMVEARREFLLYRIDENKHDDAVVEYAKRLMLETPGEIFLVVHVIYPDMAQKVLRYLRRNYTVVTSREYVVDVGYGVSTFCQDLLLGRCKEDAGSDRYRAQM